MRFACGTVFPCKGTLLPCPAPQINPHHPHTHTNSVHGRPLFAKLSIDDDAKVKIAPVHSDFICGFLPLSLMGYAGWRLNRSIALLVLRNFRALPTTVQPVCHHFLIACAIGGINCRLLLLPVSLF
jgi:hypothetical protein